MLINEIFDSTAVNTKKEHIDDIKKITDIPTLQQMYKDINLEWAVARKIVSDIIDPKKAGSRDDIMTYSKWMKMQKGLPPDKILKKFGNDVGNNENWVRVDHFVDEYYLNASLLNKIYISNDSPDFPTLKMYRDIIRDANKKLNMIDSRIIRLETQSEKR